MGMGSALDTLCGQSYGAKQYYMLGIHKQRAMLVITLACVPLAFLWAQTSQILVLCGQRPKIAAEAGRYARCMIPSLFAYGLLQCHVRFMQAQNAVFPIMLCAGLTVLVHVGACCVLVHGLGLGIAGAAFGNSISYWVYVLILACYVRVSKNCERTWNGFSREALRDVLGFIKLAVPSATMVW
uniref:Protein DETOXIFICATION 16-like n=1 Tax=Ananas comosus var. bracteatus TaxID=296719 RepID=A0A6V7Q4T5_ANACO|nr:unnamed protein product [Ananas comosus var. bracteatus]